MSEKQRPKVEIIADNSVLDADIDIVDLLNKKAKEVKEKPKMTVIDIENDELTTKEVDIPDIKDVTALRNIPKTVPKNKIDSKLKELVASSCGMENLLNFDELLNESEVEFYHTLVRKLTEDFEFNKSSDIGFVNMAAMSQIMMGRLLKYQLSNEHDNVYSKIDEIASIYERAIKGLGAARETRHKLDKNTGIAITDFVRDLNLRVAQREQFKDQDIAEELELANKKTKQLTAVLENLSDEEINMLESERELFDGVQEE